MALGVQYAAVCSLSKPIDDPAGLAGSARQKTVRVVPAALVYLGGLIIRDSAWKNVLRSIFLPDVPVTI